MIYPFVFFGLNFFWLGTGELLFIILPTRIIARIQEKKATWDLNSRKQRRKSNSLLSLFPPVLRRYRKRGQRSLLQNFDLVAHDIDLHLLEPAFKPRF
jgi:hypothetical protein